MSETHGALTRRLHTAVAGVAAAAILSHLLFRYAFGLAGWIASAPLVGALVLCGLPLVIGLIVRAIRGDLGSDHLAAISIVASSLLGEYLAGVIVVLMLAGGNTLEEYAAG